jgi:hypothetical protein
MEGDRGASVCNLHWFGVDKTAYDTDQSIGQGRELGI